MIVFAGPSIPTEEIRSVLNTADIRPPARTGDIYMACLEKPEAIGLIDGFFEGVPSVWHKEILWAMEHGTPVFGASSMGALRAAELHAFGVIGVGWIFEAYRDGRLEDDDEVALRHGPREMGYVALSEPMVNMRVTLDRAAAEGVLDQTMSSALTDMAKAMYFPERSWEALLSKASNHDLDTAVLDGLKAWLPKGRIDQKRKDALDMLAQMAKPDMPQRPSKPIPFVFQHTAMWEALKRDCDKAGPNLTLSLVLDAIRHDPERFHDIRHRACGEMLERADGRVPQSQIDRAVTQFRSENRLYTGAAFQAWLADNDVDLEELETRLAQDIMLNAMIVEDPRAFRDALIDILKEDGAFDPLMAKAKTEAEIMRDAGFETPSPEALGLTSLAMLMWYFEEFRGEAVPQDMDVFLHDLGFGDRDDFEQMMARQYVLWQHRPEEKP